MNEQSNQIRMNEIKMIFDESKAINAVLYVANRLKRRDFHKIFKVLYFADREHLINYGRTITGDRYIAMNDGPVPSNLYDIFKSVRGDGYFKDDGSFSCYFSVSSWDLIEPNKEADLAELSRTDIQFLNDAIEQYGAMSWDEVREKSHDYAWRNTIINHPIDFEDMIRESGGDGEFINYLQEQSALAIYGT